jgi:hypothetical protein
VRLLTNCLNGVDWQVARIEPEGCTSGIGRALLANPGARWGDGTAMISRTTRLRNRVNWLLPLGFRDEPAHAADSVADL